MESFPFTAHEIAQALGGEVSGRDRALVPGPGHSAKDRSLSVLVDPSAPDGFLVTSFAGDDGLEAKDYIRERLGIEEWQPAAKGERRADDWFLKKASERVAAAALPPPDAFKDKTHAIAMRLWQEASPPAGSLVEEYLQSRGLWLPRVVAEGGAIRFHPECAFKLADGSFGDFPTMLALFTDAATGEARAVHRTALQADGRGKAQDERLGAAKKMLGPARGCVIRLYPDEMIEQSLGLAEGIENAIAAICGGAGPTWAAGSAANLAAFPVLSGVEVLRIYGDRGEAGERAADAAGHRWADDGRQAEAVYPKHGDWNDAMKGRRDAA